MRVEMVVHEVILSPKITTKSLQVSRVLGRCVCDLELWSNEIDGLLLECQRYADGDGHLRRGQRRGFSVAQRRQLIEGREPREKPIRLPGDRRQQNLANLVVAFMCGTDSNSNSLDR